MENSRRDLRIELMNALYQYDIYQSEKHPFIASFEIEVAKTIYDALVDKLEDIDATIESNLYDYRLSRISYVDRAILRIATYELLYTDTPKQVVINEAIEITKIYTNLDDGKQHKFNNKVLDQIARSIKG
ncbi:MAG: transcription antitermination factor NusB [Acholeplasmataceae bacterium]|nr:transcription antitermination factor NusB [Acholeplasmataceae bacterium]